MNDLENVKMVQGVQGSRKIATITRQKEIQQQLKKEWFTCDNSDKISFSDICMSIGVYILMPILLVIVMIYTFIFY